MTTMMMMMMIMMMIISMFGRLGLWAPSSGVPDVKLLNGDGYIRVILLMI
jgi:hypothetical protein